MYIDIQTTELLLPNKVDHSMKTSL